MKSLVCFDTQVIIWGVKQQATPGQETQIDKARYLIEKCEADGVKVIVPSIVVAELLCALEPGIHTAFTELMNRRFIVPPFDTQAAMQFAMMWRAKKQFGAGEKAITRTEMKADYMIIATAVARGASCIYSEDGGLSRFAEGFIDVKPLPDAERQTTLEDFF